MKLIITGATGFLGSEILKQSLRTKEITSVVAVARKALTLDASVDTSKLKSVVVDDYEKYPDHVKDEFSQADACIWTVGVTPGVARSMDPAEVKRVCDDCTVAGFKAMYEAVPSKPFRFLYFSGSTVPEDLSKKPFFLGDYLVMRGVIANKVLDLPKEYEDVETAVAYAGLITSSGTLVNNAVSAVMGINNLLGRPIPNVSLAQVVATSLHSVVKGFEKQKLTNADLVRIGNEAIKNVS